MFAGRPVASRKGLRRFLDALAIVAGLPDIPLFHIWIVGGSSEEAAFVEEWIQLSIALKPLVNHGRILVWDHIEPTSMAELYSRALVTVVPSSFEQFGLVAVEAMACECPVVASRLGGLMDTIVPSYTGRLFDPNSILSLAICLATYLRNTSFSIFEGKNGRAWAVWEFNLEKTFRPVSEILTGRLPNTIPRPTTERYREFRRSSILEAARRIVGQQLEFEEDVSGGSHMSFHAHDESHEYFVKAMSERPSTKTAFLKLPEAIVEADRMSSSLYRAKALEHVTCVPKLIAFAPEDSIYVTEWIPQHSIEHGFQQLVKAKLVLADKGRTLRERSMLKNWGEAVEAVLAHPTCENFSAFDLSTAQLQKPLTGGHLVFTETHPQIELLRYRSWLEQPLIPVPEELRWRLRDVLCFLSEWKKPVVGVPELTHGSSSPEHILMAGDPPIICDLERVAFRFGPYDEAHWTWKVEIARGGAGFTTLIHAATHQFDKPVDRWLFVLWCVVFQVVDSIALAIEGKLDGFRRTEGMIDEIHEVIYNISPIR